MNSWFRRAATQGRSCNLGIPQASDGPILRASRCVLAGTFLVLCLNAVPVGAQSLEEEVRAMRIELRRLQQEVGTLKEELRRRTAPAESAGSGSQGSQEKSAAAQEPAAAEVLPLLQAQVAEHAQVKVESNSRLPLKIFGTIVSNTFWNSGEANWLDVPNIVAPSPDAPVPTGSFSSTMRQSRFGVIVDGPAIGSLKSSGFLALDFFGGIPNFQTGQVMGIPRLLYAFARVEGEHTAVEIGQDQMILAPRNPTSLAAMAFPDLYRSGNLYLRVPQARVEQRIAAGDLDEFQLTGGILAPIAGDFAANSLVFVPPNLAGERSRRPAAQGRVAWRRRFSYGSEDRLEIGVSGHYGRERPVMGPRRSWAGAVDLDARAGRLGIGGEWFAGRNIDAFGGSLGQVAKSTGGFLEGRLAATRRLELNAGVGIDRLFDFDLFPAPLRQNRSVFANTIFQITPELAASFEYRWLMTTPARGEMRRNNHLNLALAFSF